MRLSLALASLAATLAGSYLLDIWLWRADRESLLEVTLLKPMAVGMVANVVLPVLLAILFYSVWKASEQNKLAPILCLLVGATFVLLPVLITLIPAMRRMTILFRLPFHPGRMLLYMHAPFSRLYYSFGFILGIGVVGMSTGVRKWISHALVVHNRET